MSTRDELATYIAGHLAEDRAGFGSCDYPSDMADALIAEGWRKKPSRDEVADQIMLHAIYQGREGSAMTDASRDDHEYMYAQHAADAVLALMDRGQ